MYRELEREGGGFEFSWLSWRKENTLWQTRSFLRHCPSRWALSHFGLRPEWLSFRLVRPRPFIFVVGLFLCFSPAIKRICCRRVNTQLLVLLSTRDARACLALRSPWWFLQEDRLSFDRRRVEDKPRLDACLPRRLAAMHANSLFLCDMK